MQILLLVMNMKTTKSVCISILIICLFLVGFYYALKLFYIEEPPVAQRGHVIVIDEQEPQTTETMDEAKPHGYRVKVEDGFLTVYDTTTGEIYGYTDIEYSSLNDELQNKIVQGLYFETQKELYDFLENYTS